MVIGVYGFESFYHLSSDWVVRKISRGGKMPLSYTITRIIRLLSFRLQIIAVAIHKKGKNRNAKQEAKMFKLF